MYLEIHFLKTSTLLTCLRSLVVILYVIFPSIAALPAPATLNEAIPATGSIELSKTQTESCARALPLVVALTRSKRVASTMWVTPVFQPSMDVPSDVQEAALPSVTDSPSSFVPTDEETGKKTLEISIKNYFLVISN